MFYLHGRKGRAAGSYPPPDYPLVIEPFAGSMAYTLHHRPPHAIGIERDRHTFDMWHRLTLMTAAEIAAFPAPVVGARSSDRWVIEAARSAGGAVSAYRTVSPFMVHRFAQQRRLALRHHDYARTAVLYALGDYRQAPDIEGTWFIDPPYQDVTDGYRHGPGQIDYEEIAEWCMGRHGQVIVCEGPSGTWLPFKFHQAFPGQPRQAGPISEHVLTRRTHTRCARCSTTFPAARADARYCSGACRVAAHRERQRERSPS